VFELSLLVLEDVRETLDQLKKLIPEIFPEDVVVNVDPAETVTEALEFIDQMSARRGSYDLAILDCMVPKTRGAKPEIDETICLKLAGAMPSTVVCHMSGYDDRAIMEHNEMHHPAERSRGFFIHKTDRIAEWAPSLLERLPRMLYGLDIERRIDFLFQPRNSAVGLGITGRDIRLRGGSLTTALTMLRLDISYVWAYLGEPTKAYVRKYFVVREGVAEIPGGVAVDLL